MSKSIRITGAIGIAIIASLVVIAAPATASPRGDVAAAGGAQATPNEAKGAVVLRRDGSAATPFVADLTATTAAGSAGDGFDWGDAAVGAGIGLLAAALTMIGSSAVRSRGDDQTSRSPATAHTA